MSVIFNRRRLLKASGFGALAFTLNGCDIIVTPREARRLGADVQTLSESDALTLDRLGDVLLPGAKDAGFTHFIDVQITRPAANSLSILRYMDWPPPFSSFYASGVAALNACALAAHGVSFADLDDEAAQALIGEIAGGQPEAWLDDAPPAPLFYFVARADAVDVVYGTEEGFEQLDVPYLAHIAPPAKW